MSDNIDFVALIYNWYGLQEPKFERVFRKAIMTRGYISIPNAESFFKTYPDRRVLVSCLLAKDYIGKIHHPNGMLEFFLWKANRAFLEKRWEIKKRGDWMPPPKKRKNLTGLMKS